MNLIITSKLSSDPPSEGLYFRFLTMMAKKEINYDVVLESEQEKVDYYYNFLKQKGWFDFIDDISVSKALLNTVEAFGPLSIVT